MLVNAIFPIKFESIASKNKDQDKLFFNEAGYVSGPNVNFLLSSEPNAEKTIKQIQIRQLVCKRKIGGLTTKLKRI